MKKPIKISGLLFAFCLPMILGLMACNGEPEIPPAVVDVTSIELDKESITLEAGKSETIKATVKPDDATDKTVTWTSNDEKVATVKDGVVTIPENAAADSTAVITATAGKKTAVCTVTVAAPKDSEDKNNAANKDKDSDTKDKDTDKDAADKNNDSTDKTDTDNSNNADDNNTADNNNSNNAGDKDNGNSSGNTGNNNNSNNNNNSGNNGDNNTGNNGNSGNTNTKPILPPDDLPASVGENPFGTSGNPSDVLLTVATVYDSPRQLRFKADGTMDECRPMHREDPGYVEGKFIPEYTFFYSWDTDQHKIYTSLYGLNDYKNDKIYTTPEEYAEAYGEELMEEFDYIKLFISHTYKYEKQYDKFKLSVEYRGADKHSFTGYGGGNWVPWPTDLYYRDDSYNKICTYSGTTSGNTITYTKTKDNSGDELDFPETIEATYTETTDSNGYVPKVIITISFEDPLTNEQITFERETGLPIYNQI